MHFSLASLVTLLAAAATTVEARPALERRAMKVCGPSGNGQYAAGSYAYQGCSAGAQASLDCCNSLHPNKPNKCQKLANTNQANCDAVGSDSTKTCATGTDYQSCCQGFFGFPEGGEGSGCAPGSIVLQ